MATDRNNYQAEYKRQNYDILRILLPKGKGERVKRLAKTKGISISQVVVDALEAQYNLDLTKDNGE